MLPRPLALRLLLACLAILQGLAPGTASLLDARPAARAISERARSHVDEPGARHAFAHGEQCLFCGAATQLTAAVAPKSLLASDLGVPAAPSRAARLARGVREPDGFLRSRAPPA